MEIGALAGSDQIDENVFALNRVMGELLRRPFLLAIITLGEMKMIPVTILIPKVVGIFLRLPITSTISLML